MLNRRILRVKVMQTLYALRQSEISNYHLGLDYLHDTFSPDLNSPEVQDVAKLSQLRTTASDIYEKSFESGVVEAELPEVQVAVQKALIDYKKSVEKDRKHFERQMLENVRSIYNRYLEVFSMLIKLSDEADYSYNRGKNKYIKDEDILNEFKLVQNKIILGIKANKALEAELIKRNISFNSNSAASIYKDIIRPDEEYRKYLSSPGGFEEDKKIVLYILKTLIFKNKDLETHFEEGDIYWVEDKEIIKSMVVKTIKSVEESKEDQFSLLEISANWEEDEQFFRKLYTDTIEREETLEKIVTEKLKNWDPERLAAIDKIILKMAVSEMINFPSIPVKVTINEYIEISKEYSTPKSKQFINGILDTVSAELIANGMIRKSGRGLIDNK
ncbi:MAG: transcription antitermination factor NusB [Cytophagaceae bacterium]